MTSGSDSAAPNYVMRTRRRENTRSKILQRAADLFYRRGITGVGMQEVAEYIPVSKPTLYNHFPTKEELVAESLAAVDDRHFGWFVHQLDSVQPGAEAPAIAVFDVLDKWIKSSVFRGCAFINASVEVGSTNPPAQLAVLRHKERTRVWLRELCEQSGLTAQAAATTAPYLMLLMEGAIITALVEDDENAGATAKEAARLVVDAAGA